MMPRDEGAPRRAFLEHLRSTRTRRRTPCAPTTATLAVSRLPITCRPTARRRARRSRRFRSWRPRVSGGAAQARQLDASSSARKLAAIRAFGRYLRREGVIEGDPAALVGTPRARPVPDISRETRWRAARDARHVAAARAARPRHPRAVLRVGPASQRAGRPRPRGRQPVGPGRRVLGKGRKERIVPFNKTAEAALRAWLDDREQYAVRIHGTRIDTDLVHETRINADLIHGTRIDADLIHRTRIDAVWFTGRGSTRISRFAVQSPPAFAKATAGEAGGTAPANVADASPFDTGAIVSQLPGRTPVDQERRSSWSESQCSSVQHAVRDQPARAAALVRDAPPRARRRPARDPGAAWSPLLPEHHAALHAPPTRRSCSKGRAAKLIRRREPARRACAENGTSRTNSGKLWRLYQPLPQPQAGRGHEHSSNRSCHLRLVGSAGSGPDCRSSDNRD